MDTQLEKANDSGGNGRHSNTTLQKLEVVSGEVETVTPSTTVDAINYHNKSRGIKGDDSDGQIAWTIKSRIAVCCLVMVYVGKSSPDLTPLSLHIADTFQALRSLYTLSEAH
jgi:hypothetical protein